MSEPSHPKPVRLRDRIAWRICNWIMNHVASRWYRDMISGAVRYGLAAAAADAARNGDPLPTAMLQPGQHPGEASS